MLVGNLLDCMLGKDCSPVGCSAVSTEHSGLGKLARLAAAAEVESNARPGKAAAAEQNQHALGVVA